jgi:hypothetical protein
MSKAKFSKFMNEIKTSKFFPIIAPPFQGAKQNQVNNALKFLNLRISNIKNRLYLSVFLFALLNDIKM